MNNELELVQVFVPVKFDNGEETRRENSYVYEDIPKGDPIICLAPSQGEVEECKFMSKESFWKVYLDGCPEMDEDDNCVCITNPYTRIDHCVQTKVIADMFKMDIKRMIEFKTIYKSVKKKMQHTENLFTNQSVDNFRQEFDILRDRLTEASNLKSTTDQIYSDEFTMSDIVVKVDELYENILEQIQNQGGGGKRGAKEKKRSLTCKTDRKHSELSPQHALCSFASNRKRGNATKL